MADTPVKRPTQRKPRMSTDGNTTAPIKPSASPAAPPAKGTAPTTKRPARPRKTGAAATIPTPPAVVPTPAAAVPVASAAASADRAPPSSGVARSTVAPVIVTPTPPATPAPQEAAPPQAQAQPQASTPAKAAAPVPPGPAGAEVRLPDPVEISRAMGRITERAQQLVAEFIARQQEAEIKGEPSPITLPKGGNWLDPFNVSGAFMEMASKLASDPTRVIEAQLGLWHDYLELWQRTTHRFLGETAEPVITPSREDKRFKDKSWQENTVFDFIKQSYLLASKYVLASVQHVEGLDERTARKVDFYTKQFVDALAPSNFIMTNPEVLRATLESGGDNLIRGLENLLNDIERGRGQLAISMTDYSAFEVGRNIAVSPGKVVFQNDLMQLIQYAPTTDTVHKRPLLIIPPWINKFYILDLKPANSLIRWLTEQGHTVFCISWVNPDARLAAKSFEDYMVEGPLAALDAIKAATGEPDANVIGYCLGGTLLAATLAHMAAKGDDRFKSAMYLVTLTDFTEVGDLTVFIDEEQIEAMESIMQGQGYLDGHSMATAFNMLRSNDLIWSFVVNNYLLGRDPFPFDLLYWNSDSTRMPAAMHSFYLRNMYQKNLLVKPGGITLGGTPLDLRAIKTPTFMLSTREDHIAPWKSTYAATQLYGGPVTFVLAASGHIAGVVNPPGANKYSYWVNDTLPPIPDDWQAAAKQTPGSWWPYYGQWLEGYAGPRVPARTPGDGALPALDEAPGSYVKVRTFG